MLRPAPPSAVKASGWDCWDNDDNDDGGGGGFGGGTRGATEYEWSASVFASEAGPGRPGSGSEAPALTSSQRVKRSILCRPLPPPLGAGGGSNVNGGGNGGGSGAPVPPPLACAVFLSTSAALPRCPALAPAGPLAPPGVGPAAVGGGVGSGGAGGSGGWGGGSGALTVHAHPGAALRSALPEPLEWSLRAVGTRAGLAPGVVNSRTVAFLGGGRLRPGAKRWLHGVQDPAAAEVQVKLPEFRWSAWVGLATGAPAAAPGKQPAGRVTAAFGMGGGGGGGVLEAGEEVVHRLELRNDAGGVLCLCAVVERGTGGGAPTLVLFAEYWLRNLSSLPLVFGTTPLPTSAPAGFPGAGTGAAAAAAAAALAASPECGAGGEPGSAAVVGAALGFGGSEPLVVVAPSQASATPVVEEMFQVLCLSPLILPDFFAGEVAQRFSPLSLWC